MSPTESSQPTRQAGDPSVAPFQACDVLVVGGGINGAGIARDLAGRGLSVLLCEKDDLAAHTSSSSTKLIHGGLRYLEYYEFSLVRKALADGRAGVGEREFKAVCFPVSIDSVRLTFVCEQNKP